MPTQWRTLRHGRFPQARYWPAEDLAHRLSSAARRPSVGDSARTRAVRRDRWYGLGDCRRPGRRESRLAVLSRHQCGARINYASFLGDAMARTRHRGSIVDADRALARLTELLRLPPPRRQRQTARGVARLDAGPTTSRCSNRVPGVSVPRASRALAPSRRRDRDHMPADARPSALAPCAGRRLLTSSSPSRECHRRVATKLSRAARRRFDRGRVGAPEGRLVAPACWRWRPNQLFVISSRPNAGKPAA